MNKIEKEKAQARGRVVVLTGEGKGKTTAALGMAMRACGNGMRVLMIQFIKGDHPTGERETAKRLAPDFEIRHFGRGFVPTTGEPPAEHVAAAAEGLACARRQMASGRWGMIVLDEINYAVHYGLLCVCEVVELIESRPAGLHLVLTGRHAPEEITARADLVTEMRSLKHPMDSGGKALRGMEY